MSKIFDVLPDCQIMLLDILYNVHHIFFFLTIEQILRNNLRNNEKLRNESSSDSSNNSNYIIDLECKMLILKSHIGYSP